MPKAKKKTTAPESVDSQASGDDETNGNKPKKGVCVFVSSFAFILFINGFWG